MCVSVKGVQDGKEIGGEGEKPDEASQKCSSSLPVIDTLPLPDSFIFKAIAGQCALSATTV